MRANGLRFHVLEEGEGDRLALCLHGFPELSRSWRHQLPALAAAGHRVGAPDLRGYGQSDRPGRTADYAIEHLVDDVVGLIDASGAREVSLIGHDWGGFVAWHVASRHPARLARLAALNIPHPMPFLRASRRGPQLLRSWYVLTFQIPGLAERLLSANDHHRVAAAFTSMAVDPARFTDEDLDAYRRAAAEPGALRAMLSYYRAYLTGGGARRQRAIGFPPIEVPTLVIWGERDTALGRETLIGTREYAPDLTLRFIPHASHWVQQEAPEEVNALLSAWLRGEPVPRTWEL